MPLTKLLFKKNKGSNPSREKRNASRFSFDCLFKFQTLNPVFLKEFQSAKGQNISESGLLFKTVTPPPRKSYVLIAVDKKILGEFIAADRQLIVIDHKILAKVMRTHLNLENGLFEIGARFVRVSERSSKEVEDVMKILRV